LAVLVELGFIANDDDRAKLLDAQVREAIMREIAAVTIAHMTENG
jgi:N-acetylmuramoyl-L-alanine amidase